MPSSTSNSERRRAWPRGLLLGLALYAFSDHLLWSRPAVLAFVARYTPAGPDADPLHVQAALAAQPAQPAPLLLLGSSQVREGLDCAVLQQHLPGTPCINLAISAGSPLDLLAITARYDVRFPQRTTVIGLFPKVLHLPPKSAFVDVGTLQCLLGSASRTRLGVGAWLDVGAGLLEQLSPTLRYKDALERWAAFVAPDVRAAFAGRLPSAPRRLLEGQAPRPARYFTRRLGVLDADARAPGEFTPAQERALERLLERESARNGRVFVLDFPTRPGYPSTLPGGTLTHYRALVARLAARPDVTVLDIGVLGPLELADFQDFTHLSASGRAKVSMRLGARLAASLARGPATAARPPAR